MQLLRAVLYILLVPTCILNAYLYFYPTLKSCHFPTVPQSSPPRSSRTRSFAQLLRRNAQSHEQAPFRLLAFGDPQLEGDTSLPSSTVNTYHPHILLANLRAAAPSLTVSLAVLRRAATDLLTTAVPARLRAVRKRLDLLGNDYYLAHIYRTLRRHADPTHVAVLGDLLGSQWIDDAEFERRAARFWDRVFRGGKRIGDEITGAPTIEDLGEDREWSHRVINIAGNHDIGYAGDLTSERLARFERAFGRANWEIVFRLPLPATRPSALANDTAEEPPPPPPPDAFLRLVVLNSMNLDTPAKSADLQAATYDFLNAVIARSQPVEDRRVGTVLLTHIPLHKEASVCADGPMFTFHGEEDGRGVKEQNHISYEAGRGGVLEGLYGMSGNGAAPFGGMGRQGLILTGHDHEGCDVYHHLPSAPTNEESAKEEGQAAERRWSATRWADAEGPRAQPIPGIREVTLRSMMGNFGGWAYLISAWYEEGAELEGEWRFEVARCAIGVQHWWWAGHVLMLVTVGLGAVIVAQAVLQRASLLQPQKAEKADKAGEKASATSQRTAERREVGATAQGSSASGIAPAGENGYVKKRRRGRPWTG